MVGIVVASHSRQLAEGVIELARMMAPNVPMAAAGGLDDGAPGTSFRKIIGAVLQVYSEDGVAVFMDIGSSVMTAEMALEMLSRPKLKLFDCPLVEGAVIAAVESNMGSSLEEIEQRTVDARNMRKLH
ncbi:MAG: PTS-dependent dihydroxyacetone kinase phosphotransferase subunit DhaM [Selenomonadaceae bacterium]|nr:PTS-dependent dihydroxyacetone kinase phosphotransferase subunit DhaM [Selenomonadaceae bacterium]MBR1579283.1 PTS-dependent dihydroxyacetone kinase phosphotransferase subunit DhaM [Selenomonadaceae bacterium]